MHDPFVVHRRRLLAAAGLLVCGALALFDAASAHAQNLATCDFQAHVTLSGGSFSSDGSRSASCSGLLSGALAGSNGIFDARGSYAGDACSIGSWRGSFDAQVPTAIYIIDPQYAQVSGSLQIIQAGAGLVASGTGTVDGQPVTYLGIGSFTPDNGQGCGATGGMLTEHLVIADGGPGGASQSGAQGSPSKKSSHKKHHKFHVRRHHRHT
jgi:hypothetical protein